jgi:hypothetical protein
VGCEGLKLSLRHWALRSSAWPIPQWDVADGSEVRMLLEASVNAVTILLAEGAE